MPVPYLILDDGTKFYQRDGKLTPYTRGSAKQELFWLVEGKWALSVRPILRDSKYEVIETPIEMFRAKPSENYACGYQFEYAFQAKTLEELQRVLHIVQSYRNLDKGLIEAIANFSFDGKTAIDLTSLRQFPQL